MIQMVTDSLRYWVTETHVDGFRFDLGTILAREPNGFDDQSGFLKACSQDPVLEAVKLIAEPWDCGPGGYQVGGFPPGWAEWNDKFRDTVRDFWNGDVAGRALAPRLCASGDCSSIAAASRGPAINFVTVHDGFTLNDLVTYNEKHNEANGEDNNDGTSDNRSWNSGVEGPTDDAAIMTLRGRQMREHAGHHAAVAGHADAACRRRVRPHSAGQQQRLLPGQRDQLGRLGHRATRAASLHPLRAAADRAAPPVSDSAAQRFLTGEYNEELGIKDVTWINASGAEMRAEEWSDSNMRCFGMVMDGRAQPTGIRRRGEDATMLMVLNAHHDLVEFALPETPGGREWSLMVDTRSR